MKLSLCMIVRDEEKVIEDCLKSVQDVVDQIVVVDTGSKDGTMDICRRYGAEIYKYEWRDDFSAARNESIKYAKGDWILWMDADERLDQKSVGEVGKLLTLERKPIAYKVLIKNFRADGSYYFSDAHRIFRNGVGIHFTGVIHEQISPSVLALGGELRDTEIVINHIGYSYTGDKEKRKKERNRKLLLEYVEKEPDNAYAHYTLGQFYALDRNFEKALEHYLVAYELNQFDSSLKCSLLNVIAESYIELGEYERAREFAVRSRRLCPDQVSCYYLLYKISEKDGDYVECLRYLSLMLEKMVLVREGRKEISTDVVVDENKILYTRILCGVRANDVDSVRNDVRRILAKQNVSSVLLENILKLSMELKVYDVALEILDKLWERKRENRYLEMKGILYIKLGNFKEALSVYQRLFELAPNNDDYIKKLAGLYGKLGDLDSASKYVRLLNK